MSSVGQSNYNTSTVRGQMKYLKYKNMSHVKVKMIKNKAKTSHVSAILICPYIMSAQDV